MRPAEAPAIGARGRRLAQPSSAAMFWHLRTKLTVLYASLFAVILLLIAVAALAAVSDNARRVVRSELATSSMVFEHLWTQRTQQFENDAVLLSRDFGFRGAVATNDDPTIRSALENLKVRLGIDKAMMIAADGHIIVAGHADAQLDRPTQAALQGEDTVAGVLTLGGEPYEAVSVPMGDGMAGGWVVFAAKLDRAQMRSLESMAAIPLTATVACQLGSGRWGDNASPAGPAGDPRIAPLVAAAAKAKGAPITVPSARGAAMVMVKPLRAIVPGRPIVLLLRYPLAGAMAPFRLLLGLLLITGVAGFGILVAGTWVLARSVTRPVSQLEEAARRLQRGERVQVGVETRDEIGRLAETFNSMAAEITQRETELASARDLAEAANRAKSSFLANMSHEVRTPLNGVIGVAGVLAGADLTPDQQRMVGIINSSATVLQRVLDDVLDLARVEAGRLEIVPDAFDLAGAVRSLAERAEIQCQTKGLAFELTMDRSLGAVVGDRLRLEQIIGNLLSNAVKFTERGGVRLSVDSGADGAVAFVVRDTGIGFDAAAAALLFKPFQQADSSITRRFGGTGLGLSISRELAQAMGGALRAEGEPGVGATFTLTLRLPPSDVAPVEAAPAPALAPAAPTDRGGAAPAEEDAGPPIRVLVADDHETNRTVVQLILGSAGVDVTCVEDGARAVSAYEAGGFDLILMDMQMPVMDGLSAIRAIRERERLAGAARLPILMLSANAMSEHVEASRAAGADGHVAKPINTTQLIAAIEAALSAAADASDRWVAA